MTNLFRAEALQHQRQSWIGDVQSIRPPSLALMTTLVMLVAAMVGAFLFIGEYTRKARTIGVLLPDKGVIRLLPPVAATIVERHAREGQRVRQGEILFVLSPDVSTRGGDTQLAIQRTLDERSHSLQGSAAQQEQLVSAERHDLDQRLADMQREAEQIGAELALNDQRLALARAAQARLESLEANRFVSTAQVQGKAEEVLALRSQHAALERQRMAQQRQISALEAERSRLPLREIEQRAAIGRELQHIAQQQAEAEARHRIVVRAPQDALVTAVSGEVGQGASTDIALASLVPADARLQAHLYAPSSAVGLIAPEQPVLLRYQAFPYQKFGHQSGRIVAVSRTPLQSNELSGLPLQRASQEPLYRIVVELDRQTIRAYGDERTLTPGMQLEADVLLDRRRLIEWIFEPVISLSGRV